MALEDEIALLRRLEFFQGFEDEHLRMIAFGSQKMRFPEGTEIFHAGQTSDGAYVVLEGKIALGVALANGTSKTEEIGPGGLIGEMSLISRNKRAGTAFVVEAAETLKIRRDAIHRILEEYPQLAVGLHQSISRSVVEIGKELEKVHRRMPTDAA